MKFLPILGGKQAAGEKSALDNIFDAFGKKEKPQDVEFRAKLDKFAEAGAQRLLDVFNAKVVPLAPDYVSPVHLKSKQESEFLKQALSGAFLFDMLRKHELHELILAFEKYQVAAGTQIIKEGDKVEYFYILQTGTIASDGDEKESGPGDFVGELALLYDYPSEATLTATTDCVLWRLDQVTFRKVLAAQALRQDKETKALLRRVTMFQELDDAILTRVAFALQTETYEKGDSIVRKGDECKSFYIVKEGTVKGTDIVIGESKYDDFIMKAGDSFGAYAISKNKPLAGNVTAEEHVTMLCLPRQLFIKLFGDMADLITRSQDKKKLMAIPVAGKPKLEDHELELLMSFITNKTFPRGHVFFKQGYRPTNALYLMRSGKVSVRSSALGADLETLVGIFGFTVEGETTTVSEGGYFGADSLYSPGEAKPSPYTITAEEDCTIGVLTMEDILSILLSREKEPVPLNELEMYRILGAGTFGKVWLCSKRNTKDAYALKVQSKRKMIEYGQVEGVIREKDAMARLDHPFIIKLVSSYKDDRSLYMLMVLYQGGELRSVIQTDKRLGVPEKVAAFYAANMLQGLSFMHERRILHRDLKPENVLLNSEGYTVLVDLGFARVVRDRTYTFCGTPTYIAPEVINQKGYDKSADLWSWGVMVYEMIVGINPFYDRKMSEMTLYRRIIKGEYDFPSGDDFMSGESKSLIRQMLATDPTERLGCFAKAHQDIRDQPWFRNVDFLAIDEMKAKVPWVPKITDPLDGGNYAHWDHLDKEEDEKPLSAREQRLFDAF